LQLDDKTIYQKRMVKDCKLSEIRALAGKIGGDKRVINSSVCLSKNKANSQAKVQANTVIEYEYEYDSEIDNTSGTDSSKDRDYQGEGNTGEKKKRKKQPVIQTDEPEFFDEELHTPLEKAIHDFIEFRKSKKQPMTDNALKLLIGKLDKLMINGTHYTDEQKIEVLENSIINGWTGIYELRGKAYNNKPTMEDKIERLFSL